MAVERSEALSQLAEVKEPINPAQQVIMRQCHRRSPSSACCPACSTSETAVSAEVSASDFVRRSGLTFVREKIQKPIDNARMIRKLVLFTAPRALVQPLVDDREIDCRAAGALFHQPLKAGKDAPIDSSRV
jgi:hypothetical protein